MRRAPTEAEARLWAELRGSRLGSRFRRQHAIGRYIVDFYCPKRRLVVEVDGGIHGGATEEDALRTALLESRGIEVLRFTNDDVEQNLERVIERITEVLGREPYSPSPFAERGPGGEV
jgi:very-short-patch-repair endonuclease